jgi:hypothetical protein
MSDTTSKRVEELEQIVTEGKTVLKIVEKGYKALLELAHAKNAELADELDRSNKLLDEAISDRDKLAIELKDAMKFWEAMIIQRDKFKEEAMRMAKELLQFKKRGV